MGSWSTVWSFSVSLPVSFALRQNYPNPFNNSTTIRFDSPVPVAGAITIFNIFGQKIKTLYSGSFRAGPNTFSWDGTNDAGLRVSTGVYFYALRTSVFSDVKKMMFLR
jgi:flagellar hook assembly protein FlgD